MNPTRKHGAWLPMAAVLLLSACTKPGGLAPAEHFSERHGCPARSVETTRLSSERLLVSGCGESVEYVRDCANRSSAALPAANARQPVLEGEARTSSSPFPSETGCAWTRAPGTGSPPPGE